MGLLHLMRAAFAIEDMTRFARAFALALFRLLAAAHVRTGFIAASDFLFGGSNDGFFLIRGHGNVPWSCGFRDIEAKQHGF